MIPNLQNLSVYVPRVVSKDETFTPGHRACVGCCEALAVRHVCKALGRNVIVVNATGCMDVISSAYPNSSWEFPWIHTLFENTAAVASGVAVALDVMRRKGKVKTESRIKVVAMGGDGGTADIGMQALSGMLERGHDVLYVCFDNEAYMNTGIQRSSATPFGATTTTSPAGEKSKGQKTWKKNMPAIAAAHGIPYVATASPAYPFDLIEKVKKAVAIEGPTYLHVFSACPTGWRSKTETAIRESRWATEACIFPLYEVEHGVWKLSYIPDPIRPIAEYFKVQGRFRHLSEDDIQEIQQMITANFENLKKLCGVVEKKKTKKSK